MSAFISDSDLKIWKFPYKYFITQMNFYCKKGSPPALDLWLFRLYIIHDYHNMLHGVWYL